VKVRLTRRLIGKGALAPSPEWAIVRSLVFEVLQEVDWPLGSRSFSINPERRGNGVIPIKKRVGELLASRGWSTEERWPIPDLNLPGRMDGAYRTAYGLVAFEWETGNVASSHRSLNKMCLGLTLGSIAGGILALSTRSLGKYLTDRIGTFEEIEAYLPLWQATPCETGVLEIIAVEHDKVSSKVPLIPKALVGRASERKS
jgi:hypothetical protein